MHLPGVGQPVEASGFLCVAHGCQDRLALRRAIPVQSESIRMVGAAHK